MHRPLAALTSSYPAENPRFYVNRRADPMSANRRLTICLAVLTVNGLTPACRARTPAPEMPPVAGSAQVRDARPRSDIWIAYSPSGLTRSAASNARGSETVTGGHLRPPIFSARIRSIADDGIVEADLLMPAGFDRRYVRAEDIRVDGPSGNPESNATLRHERRKEALMHHRPPLRLRIDAKGTPHVEITPELQRHACERRLLRAAAQARLATAQDDVQKSSQQLRLEGLTTILHRPLRPTSKAPRSCSGWSCCRFPAPLTVKTPSPVSKSRAVYQINGTGERSKSGFTVGLSACGWTCWRPQARRRRAYAVRSPFRRYPSRAATHVRSRA